jgi:hypothetical protein
VLVCLNPPKEEERSRTQMRWDESLLSWGQNVRTLTIEVDVVDSESV